jgi:hypothetical protein
VVGANPKPPKKPRRPSKNGKVMPTNMVAAAYTWKARDV